jgi:hypothetical protein
MVTIEQVRVQISDQPQMWPTQAEPPELLGTSDGVQTVYALRYRNRIEQSLTVYTADAPSSGTGDTPDWTATTGYTIEGNLVTFNSAPAKGTLLGARYQATAFSDADLFGYLQRAKALYSDDLSLLKRVQYDIIDVLLMDYDRLYLLAQGEYRTEPTAFAESLKQLKAELRKDLTGDPVPGSAVPVLSIGTQVTRRYQPWR